MYGVRGGYQKDLDTRRISFDGAGNPVQRAIDTRMFSFPWWIDDGTTLVLWYVFLLEPLCWDKRERRRAAGKYQTDVRLADPAESFFP